MGVRIGIDCRKIADFGIGTYVRGLVSALIATEGEERFVLFAPAEATSLIPPSPRIDVIEESTPGYSFREPVVLGRKAAKAKLDLFHAPHYVVPLTDLPLVVTIHDLIHLRSGREARGPLAPLYARFMIGRAVRRARRILTVTDAVRRDIESHFPASRGKIAVTPNGIDETFRRSLTPEEIEETARRYGTKAGRYFLFVGNDKPHKNVERLVEAFRRLGAERGWDLVLAGAPMERFASGHVRTAGFVPEGDLAALYRGAIALVQPSLHEGFGLPVAEAMASGTAVLIAREPALEEVAGDASLVFDPASVEEIAEAMVKAGEDATLRARLAARGIVEARRFTWSQCAETTLAIYRDLLRGRR